MLKNKTAHLWHGNKHGYRSSSASVGLILYSLLEIQEKMLDFFLQFGKILLLMQGELWKQRGLH